MFIEKIKNIDVDLEKIKADLSWVLTQTQWAPENQIGFTYRTNTKNNKWKDCVGSLYDEEKKIELIREDEFTEINDLVPEYTKTVLNLLAQQVGFKLGRVRYMLLESKRGLTVHYDTSVRYHLAIETNPYAYMAHTVNNPVMKAVCYHIPADGSFYCVDTKKEHFVFNGGTDPRIHIVICPI